MYDDIPEATRDRGIRRSPSPRPRRWLFFLGLALATALLLGGLSTVLQWQTASNPVQTQPSPVAVTATPSPTASPSPNQLLGHLAYPEAPQSDLQPISSDGRIKLRSAAAQEYTAMVEAARAAGIDLVPISGFRSIQDQQYLFFDVKAERAQTTAERAKVSAPPGYSEHHTGYAIDVGDGNYPEANLKVSFENTPAFQWLEKNAARFSFELSFPPGNPQGVTYEPWHWRFVGDSDSLKTFYQARQLK